MAAAGQIDAKAGGAVLDAPRCGVEELQRAMVDAWPPLERAHLGDWIVRAGRGFTARANSCVTAGSPGVPVADAVAWVEAWYAARSLPANFCLAVPPARPDTHAELAALLVPARGYAAGPPTRCLTASSVSVASGSAGGPTTSPGARSADSGLPPVRLSDTLTEEWLAAFGAYRPIDEVAARAILTGSPAQVFASVSGPEGLVAIGRLGLADGWGGIASMWVDPAHRGRGLGRAVLTKLSEAAYQRGSHDLHLQVDAANTTALALYGRLGFTLHHTYVNLVQDPS